jgi:hypothetical protein
VEPLDRRKVLGTEGVHQGPAGFFRHDQWSFSRDFFCCVSHCAFSFFSKFDAKRVLIGINTHFVLFSVNWQSNPAFVGSVAI